MHFVISMSYLVVRRLPSSLSSASMVMANAGQTASQSLHAIHLSSPLGYRRRACSPRNRGDNGPFSNGYMIVYGGRKNCSRTIHIPRAISVRRKVLPAMSNTLSSFCNQRDYVRITGCLFGSGRYDWYVGMDCCCCACLTVGISDC
jgi:hypothetical protein